MEDDTQQAPSGDTSSPVVSVTDEDVDAGQCGSGTRVR